MIKLPTAILLLVKVSEPLVSSHELNLNEIFLVLLVIYFALNLSTMLEFCGMGTRLKIKKKQKNMFQDLRQRTPMETFHFKDARSTTRKWWSLWQRRCLICVISYLRFKLKRSLATPSLQRFQCKALSIEFPLQNYTANIELTEKWHRF